MKTPVPTRPASALLVGQHPIPSMTDSDGGSGLRCRCPALENGCLTTSGTVSLRLTQLCRNHAHTNLTLKQQCTHILEGGLQLFSLYDVIAVYVVLLEDLKPRSKVTDPVNRQLHVRVSRNTRMILIITLTLKGAVLHFVQSHSAANRL